MRQRKSVYEYYLSLSSMSTSFSLIYLDSSYKDSISLKRLNVSLTDIIRKFISAFSAFMTLLCTVVSSETGTTIIINLKINPLAGFYTEEFLWNLPKNNKNKINKHSARAQKYYVQIQYLEFKNL